MIQILGLFPLSGNGGIASWTKKFLASFPDTDYQIIPVSNSPAPRNGNEGLFDRICTGLTALKTIKGEVVRVVDNEHPQILHTTTSGSIGSLRDYLIGKFCKKKGVKTIMHCRYGCITEDVKSHGLIGMLLRAALDQFDQIWVLDSRSYNTLKSIPKYSHKVRLTPNSIKVPDSVDLSPKEYKRVGFVGNLIPSKGLYELVEAATKTEVRLDIIGPGSNDVIENIKCIAGDKIDKSIFIHGKLPNDQAVKYVQKLDIIALPTYYPFEAFPISILEAMSLGKLVISCPRAAVSDMLTGLDGRPCGILVEAKSSQSIIDAINWVQNNPDKADELCRSAYDKVKSKYDTSVVYEIYRTNYQEVLNQ